MKNLFKAVLSLITITFLIIFSGCTGIKSEEAPYGTEVIPIKSLSINQELIQSGTFVLGTGTMEGTTKTFYRTYIKLYEECWLVDLPTDRFSICEDSSVSPRIIYSRTFKQYQRGTLKNPNGQQPGLKYGTGKIIVPVGTIKQEIKL